MQHDRCPSCAGRSYRQIWFLLFVLLVPWPGNLPPARAATQGLLEEDSTGTINISLTIQPSIRIETTDSINLRIRNRDVDTFFYQDLCITGNFGGKYTLTAFGSGPSDRFSLTNDASEELAYLVAYRGDPEQERYDQLEPASPSPAYNLTHQACVDRDAFRITFRAEDLTRAESGLYTGHLTLLVSPV